MVCMAAPREDLRYPIGPFSFSGSSTSGERQKWIRDIAHAPAALRAAVAGLSAEQLDTPYRPGGWTVRQVVHHIPDSHMHSFLRMKNALAEDHPTIQPYDEARWATLADYNSTPVEVSLALLEALHARWVALLTSMTSAYFERTFFHPESGIVRLDRNLASYSWHGRHHTAHITALRERMGWK
jgi:uncharacterized damage-inducible protein DinB